VAVLVFSNKVLLEPHGLLGVYYLRFYSCQHHLTLWSQR